MSLAPEQITHAGAVVVRRTGDGEPLYLVIQARRNPMDWVLPKGHVERGESTLEAAQREVAEEAGVAAGDGPSLGTIAWSQKGKRVRGEFFLLPEVGTARQEEARAVRWCPFADALALLSFEAPREILQRARDATRT